MGTRSSIPTAMPASSASSRTAAVVHDSPAPTSPPKHRSHIDGQMSFQSALRWATTSSAGVTTTTNAVRCHRLPARTSARVATPMTRPSSSRTSHSSSAAPTGPSVLELDGLARAGLERLLDLGPQLLARRLVEDVQEIVVRSLEALGRPLHADGVALAQIKIHDDSHPAIMPAPRPERAAPLSNRSAQH